MSSSILSIDWLSVTLPATSWTSGDPREILELLDLPKDDFEERDRGFYAYSHSAKICGGAGMVAWGGKRQNGTLHVSFPGSALAFFRDVLERKVTGLLDLLLNLGAKVTRLDLAFDDRPSVSDACPVLFYEKLMGCLCVGAVQSRMRNYRVVQDKVKIGEVFDAASQGWTIYIGSRCSNSFVRVYNKAAEQAVEGHWVRVELVVKGKKAPVFARAWQAQGFASGYAVGLLLGLLDFKEQLADSNKSRWPTAAFWVDFLGTFEKVTVAVTAKMRSAEQTRQWVFRQVAPALAVLDLVWGDNIWLNLVEDGASRFQPIHYAMVLAAGGGVPVPAPS